MALKPQDLAIVLKLVADGAARPSYAKLGLELCMSPSEVHAGVSRARLAQLLAGPALGDKPNLAGLLEFLICGVRYAFPPRRGSLTRGMPTGYAAPPLSAWISVGSDPPPVWPWKDGVVRGLEFSPLYKGAPRAAIQDPKFYEWLALVDALRGGRARERELAQKEMKARLASPGRQR